MLLKLAVEARGATSVVFLHLKKQSTRLVNEVRKYSRRKYQLGCAMNNSEYFSAAKAYVTIKQKSPTLKMWSC